MTYRVSYVDTASQSQKRLRLAATPRDEFFPTEPAALARARELMDDTHCHAIVVSDGSGEPLRGVRLQLKLGLSIE